MIDAAEIEQLAGRFGVPATQVRRDHLISHILHQLGPLDGLTFFGGTALCRTWIPDLRLSEDIDLLVDDSVDREQVRRAIGRGLRREFADPTWSALGSVHDLDSWVLSTSDLEVRVQFVPWRLGWKSAIPTGTVPVRLRYSDLPESVSMTVPTTTGFAAMKLLAWYDRKTPRDLYDLAALADAGHIDDVATAIVRSLAGFTPSTDNLDRSVPRAVVAAWRTELGHQITNLRTASECLDAVARSLGGTQASDTDNDPTRGVLLHPDDG